MGDSVRARPSFEEAREVLERERTIRPDDARIHSSLGVVYAVLGEKEAAVREAKRAVELTPISADALRGPTFVEWLAWSYVLMDDYDAAIKEIDYLLSVPALFSVPALRRDPRWDPLRDHPEFKRVLREYS
jgi:Flp pilus assembly protein TadD